MGTKSSLCFAKLLSHRYLYIMYTRRNFARKDMFDCKTSKQTKIHFPHSHLVKIWKYIFCKNPQNFFVSLQQKETSKSIYLNGFFLITNVSFSGFHHFKLFFQSPIQTQLSPLKFTLRPTFLTLEFQLQFKLRLVAFFF